MTVRGTILCPASLAIQLVFVKQGVMLTHHMDVTTLTLLIQDLFFAAFTDLTTLVVRDPAYDCCEAYSNERAANGPGKGGVIHFGSTCGNC